MLRSNLNMKPLVVIINRHFFFLQKLAKILHQVREKYIIQNYYYYLTLHIDRSSIKKIEEANVRNDLYSILTSSSL